MCASSEPTRERPVARLRFGVREAETAETDARLACVATLSEELSIIHRRQSARAESLGDCTVKAPDPSEGVGENGSNAG